MENRKIGPLFGDLEKFKIFIQDQIADKNLSQKELRDIRQIIDGLDKADPKRSWLRDFDLPLYNVVDGRLSLRQYNRSLQVRGPALKLKSIQMDNFGRIAFSVQGSGPNILLVHGFPDNQETWRELVPELVNAGYCVWTVDMPGFGGSELASRSKWTPTLGSDFLNHFIRNVIQKETILFGTDVGGVASWNAAFEDGQNDTGALIKGLVLMNCRPNVSAPVGIELKLLANKTIASMTYGALLLLNKINRDLAERTFIASLSRAYEHPYVHHQYATVTSIFKNETNTRNTFAVMKTNQDYLKRIGDGQAENMQRKIRIPTLILSSKDKLISKQAMQKFDESIPDSKLAYIPGPHFAEQEQWLPIAENVVRFLAEKFGS